MQSSALFIKTEMLFLSRYLILCIKSDRVFVLRRNSDGDRPAVLILQIYALPDRELLAPGGGQLPQ